MAASARPGRREGLQIWGPDGRLTEYRDPARPPATTTEHPNSLSSLSSQEPRLRAKPKKGSRGWVGAQNASGKLPRARASTPPAISWLSPGLQQRQAGGGSQGPRRALQDSGFAKKRPEGGKAESSGHRQARALLPCLPEPRRQREIGSTTPGSSPARLSGTSRGSQLTGPGLQRPPIKATETGRV